MADEAGIGIAGIVPACAGAAATCSRAGDGSGINEEILADCGVLCRW